jgi:hypothetical protein
LSLDSDTPDVWEDANYGGCPTQDHDALISAAVTDPSGVASVTITWAVGSGSGATAMTPIGGDVYVATIGPFPDSTLSNGESPISLTIKAIDGAGNPTTETTDDLVVLHNCSIG